MFVSLTCYANKAQSESYTWKLFFNRELLYTGETLFVKIIASEYLHPFLEIIQVKMKHLGCMLYLWDGFSFYIVNIKPYHIYVQCVMIITTIL